MIEQVVLRNGIKIVLESNKHYNSAAFGVWIGVGSRNETKENNGMAHMIEHMLFKGTTNRTAEEIARQTAVLGGNLNAYTTKECTTFYSKTLPEDIYTAIEIIGDMISHPLINEEDLEKEKLVVCEEIDMYNDSCEDYVHEYLQKKVWKDNALGYLISGKKKIVKKFTKEDIISFMKDYYTGSNIVISIAGNFDKEKVIKTIKSSFKEIKKNPLNKKSFSKNLTPEYQAVSLKKKKDIEQLHMNIAFPMPSFKDELRYEFAIINAILGGDVNSRLFQEIREKYGLTYNICSYRSAFSDTGLFHIYAALNANQEEKVLELIKAIILELRENGITEAELVNAKKQVIAEMTLNRDNTVVLMSTNANSLMFQDRIYTFKQTINAINKVSIDSVNECFKKYFDLEIMSIALAGNIN